METEDSKSIQLDPLSGEARSVNHPVPASNNNRFEKRRMQCNEARAMQCVETQAISATSSEDKRAVAAGVDDEKANSMQV